MYYLVYVSSAIRPFASSELVELLSKAHVHNTKVGITGMLLYKDGNFMQVIEGEEESARALHARIKRDPRHRGMLTLLQGPLAERQFPDWSMGFKDPNAADVRSAPGHSDFRNCPLTETVFSKDPTRRKKPLMTFKKIM